MMDYCGLDPGNTHTALVILNAGRIVEKLYAPNDEIVSRLKRMGGIDSDGVVVGIERIASYGMAVGETVFETCRWCGEFRRILKDRSVELHEITRIRVKSHLCHSGKAKDGNVRQRLIDLFGPAGTKKAPGPTYQMSGDLWAALAVAVTLRDTVEENREAA